MARILAGLESYWVVAFRGFEVLAVVVAIGFVVDSASKSLPEVEPC